MKVASRLVQARRLVPQLLIPLAVLSYASPVEAQRTRAFPSRGVPASYESPPARPPATPCVGSCSDAAGSPRGIPGVYLQSGELHLEEVDLIIPGRGLDFVWTRTYRSRTGRDTDQGHGWTHSYDIRVFDEGSGVRVLDGGGRADVYHRRADNTYVARELFREGHFEPDGSFVLVFADSGTWTFHPLDGSPHQGRISAITDRNGNAIVFEYDLSGRLSLVVDTLARGIQVRYRPDGRLGSLVDFTGREVLYDYYGTGETGGGPGDLRSARSPLVVGTPNGNDFPAGKTTAYSYSRGFADERLNHNLLTVTDPRGQTWMVNEYGDSMGAQEVEFDRLLRQRRGYDGDVIDVHYAIHPETPTYPEDPIIPAWPIVPKILAIVNDRVGNVSDYLFDERGHCIRQRLFTGRANPDLPTTRKTNRPQGRLRPSDPAFFETSWEHNEDALVTHVVHPNGNEVRQVHELELDPQASWRARGNLRERHRLPGSHTPVGDQPSLSETFEYDTGFGGCCGTNFVTRQVDARGNTTEHDYDASGNRIQTRHRITGIVEDFTYNAFGQMTSHTLPDNGSGWRQRNEWIYYGPAAGDQEGYLAQEIVDAGGLSLTTSMVYDQVGNALQTTDARGSTTTMVVNALDQVVEQTSPAVQMLGGASAQYRMQTWYDANDNVVRSDVLNIDDQGQLSAANPSFTTSFQYEILNQLIRRAQEVDVGVDVVTETEYDANRNRTLERRGEAVNGNQATNVVRTLFDERDRPFRRIEAEGDANAFTTQFDYDRNGNAVLVRAGLEDLQPQLTQTTYDAYGRPVHRVDPMGNETLSEYDPNGNEVRMRVLGELCDVTGSAGNTRLYEATFAYDAMDRRVASNVHHFDAATQVALGDGMSTTVQVWTDRSDVAETTDDNGNTTTCEYDTAGRLFRSTDAAHNYVEEVYDANGNVVARMDAERSGVTGTMQFFVTSMSYDTLDRIVAESDPVGNRVRLGYDSRDNTTLVIDALGNTTRRTFDGLGRMLASERVLTDTGTGGGGVVGTLERGWEWDASSRLTSRMDPDGNVTRYAYDALDRRTAVTYADGTRETLQYDVHGNVVLRLDPNGTRVTSQYDALDRILGRAITPGAGVSSDTTFEIWKHDGLSRIIQAQDDDTLVTRSWDSIGRCQAETQNGRTFLLVHDGVGNQVQVTYPGGQVVRKAHDELNRIATVSHAGVAARYEYVGPGRIEQRITGAGIATSTYGYDGARRMTSVHHDGPGAAPIDHRTYAWDAAYNKLQMAAVTGANGTHDFAYDSQYRLVRTQVRLGGVLLRDTQYTLDPAGNRTMVTGDACSGTYTLDASAREPADEQMNQYTSTPCIGCLEYDANGNEILRNNERELARDYRNRIVAHTDLTTNERTSYAYDALGRRVSKAGPTATVEFTYLGDRLVEEWSGNQLLTSFVRGAAGELVERTSTGGVVHYFFADDLGSTRAVTDASGAVVERYDYSDYGAPAFFDGAGLALPGSQIGNAWLFTGQFFDVESSYYDYRSRHFDPLSGRFLSRDPLGLWGDPTNLGVGAGYVGNNPQTLVDPTGMFSARVNCGGPWPGPKRVYYQRLSCDVDPRIPNALCAAMRGAGRGLRDFMFWWSHVQDPPAGSQFSYGWTVKGRFENWFGGPDGRVAESDMARIFRVLTFVNGPFSHGRRIPIACSSPVDATCAGANAYSSPCDDALHLCSNWFLNPGFNNNRRAAILLHEMAHEYGGLGADTFYYQQNSPNSLVTMAVGPYTLLNTFETKVLVRNADTYEEFYFRYHVQ